MHQILRRFIAHELVPGFPEDQIGLDDPLFELILDSASVMALVAFMEQEFQLQIPDTDIVPAHFNTLRCLSGYIASRGGGRQQAASAP